jgi:hypothetical protein
MRRTDGNPWSPADPAAEWWSGDTGAFPAIGATPSAAQDAGAMGGPPGGAEGDPTRPRSATADSTARTGGPAKTSAPKTSGSKTGSPAKSSNPVKTGGPAKTGSPTKSSSPARAGSPAKTGGATNPGGAATSKPDTTEQDPARTAPPRRARRTTVQAASPVLPPAYGADADEARAAGERDVNEALDLPVEPAEPAAAAQHGPATTGFEDLFPETPPGTISEAARPVLAEPDQERDLPNTEAPNTEALSAEAPSNEGPNTEAASAEAPSPEAAGNEAPGAPDGADASESGSDDDQAGSAEPADGGVPPDVMVLPEPVRPRDRPTVIINRAGVPGQPKRQEATVPGQGGADLMRADVNRATPGRADPARLQAIEESSFWLTTEEAARDRAAGSPPGTQDALPPAAASRLGVPPHPRDLPRKPRTPFVGLAALMVLAFAAAFFAWVSAEPIWLAVGHGDQGTVTVARCAGDGIARRCVGTFTDGAFTVDDVALLGVDAAERRAGVTVPARMVDRQSRQAFVNAPGLLLHLRWVVGVGLLLLCGLCIAGTTGARRLETPRARRWAVLLSLAGPLALLAGFLLTSY